MANLDVSPALVASTLVKFLSETKGNGIILYDSANHVFSKRSKFVHFGINSIRKIAEVMGVKRFVAWADKKLDLEKSLRDPLAHIKVVESNQEKNVLTFKDMYTVNEIKEAVKIVQDNEIAVSLSANVDIFARVIKNPSKINSYTKLPEDENLVVDNDFFGAEIKDEAPTNNNSFDPESILENKNGIDTTELELNIESIFISQEGKDDAKIQEVTQFFNENDAVINNDIYLTAAFRYMLEQATSAQGQQIDLKKLSVLKNSTLYYLALEVCISSQIDVSNLINEISYADLKTAEHITAFEGLFNLARASEYKQNIDIKQVEQILNAAMKNPTDTNIGAIFHLLNSLDLKPEPKKIYKASAKAEKKSLAVAKKVFKHIFTKLTGKEISNFIVTILKSENLPNKARYIEEFLELSDKNKPDFKEEALKLAVKIKDTSCVGALLKESCSPNMLNTLLTDKRQDYSEIIITMLNQADQRSGQKVNLDATDKQNYTPLMHAIENNQKKCIAIILKKTKKIDQKSKQGETALMIAVRAGNLDAVDALIEAKAKLSIKYKGNTAEDIAKAIAEQSPDENHDLIYKRLKFVKGHKK